MCMYMNINMLYSRHLLVCRDAASDKTHVYTCIHVYIFRCVRMYMYLDIYKIPARTS